MGVTHNDEADAAPRSVVEGRIEPDITFTGAEPTIGGPHTWSQCRTNNKNDTTTFAKLPNLHSGIRKLINKHTSNNTTNPYTIYGNMLREARDSGVDHAIHTYSNTPYRAR